MLAVVVLKRKNKPIRKKLLNVPAIQSKELFFEGKDFFVITSITLLCHFINDSISKKQHIHFFPSKSAVNKPSIYYCSSQNN